MQEPPYRFCNFVLAWCYARLTAEKRAEWEYMLEEPLPGDLELPTKNDLEAETAEFMRTAAAIAGG